MEVQIYSVKAKSEADSIGVKKIWWKGKKAKAAIYSAGDRKYLRILLENWAEGLGSRRSAAGLCICLWEYTQKIAASST